MSTTQQGFASSDEIRSRFSLAMSDMYKAEVPLYGDLLELVERTNRTALEESPELENQLYWTGEITRLSLERHGAIRLGTAGELHMMKRLFAVMGMVPVGYYDLSKAGVPVHATAFRATSEESLKACPFRVFTSLLRLDLIDNQELRELATSILAKRDIFTPRARELVLSFEAHGGLNPKEASEFVKEALETFRWHTRATVSADEYQRLHDQHRLIADVVAFKGPHINHLTPRTLDIDKIQEGMAACGIPPKAVVEGPPRRKCPILLRQTSFKALEERVAFTDQSDAQGSHSARFGEIEQRGVALTKEGRALYDKLLAQARSELSESPNESNADRYKEILENSFYAFPDTYEELRQQRLAYFKYFVTDSAPKHVMESLSSLEDLISSGYVHCEPLVYEDFLPVSAAGIFQSNLGEGGPAEYATSSDQQEFEKALGAKVFNEIDLYADAQSRSIEHCFSVLKLPLPVAGA
ncbi:2-oxoadipate dioxygenase/decarboxylase HglS [Pseudomonas sp. LB3P14]